MKLTDLYEAVPTKSVGIALPKIISYLNRKLGVQLIKIPGIEHFHNSTGTGFGIRYVVSGSTRCIRFNWNTSGSEGQSSSIHSVDLFTGSSRNPNFTIYTKGISFVQALPMVATIARSPTLGKFTMFPVSPKEALAESLTEDNKSKKRPGNWNKGKRPTNFDKYLGIIYDAFPLGKKFTTSDAAEALIKAKAVTTNASASVYASQVLRHLHDVQDHCPEGVMLSSSGAKYVFKSSIEETAFTHILQDMQILTEVKRDTFTGESALDDFLKKLASGKTFTRSDFIGQYHIVHAGIFDTIMKDFSDRFIIDNRRIALASNAKLKPLKDAIMAKAGIVEVVKGGTKEVYLPTAQEQQLEKDVGEEKVSFSDTLEHLEGLVHALIKGSYNALFCCGRGGCLSADTLLNIKIGNGPATTASMQDIEDVVKHFYEIDRLVPKELYKLEYFHIETPTGYKDILGFMCKVGLKSIVTFESGIQHVCLSNHMYIPHDDKIRHVYNLKPGDKILTRDGYDTVKSIEITSEEMVAYDLSVNSLEGIYLTADGIQHHNTGKTQTVERALHDAGLSDGKGYFKNTGSASAAGVYTLLYHHRNDIILFDDSDGALGDQDARNLIKAATDTKKIRKMVWNKKSSFIFNPDVEDPAQYEDDLSMAPQHFDFKGRIIFISNLTPEKLDPDGALQSRAFVLNVNPSDKEVFDHMGKILHDIKLEDGLSLTKEQKEHVLNVVKSSTRKGEVSLRKLVRGLNLAASGAPNWEVLVSRYA